MDMEVFVKEIINDIPANFDELVVRINRKTLPSFFVIIHFTLVALSLRQRTGARSYAKFHPFASWFVCVVSCLAGSLVQAILLNTPILDVFLKNNTNILFITLIWYLVMFSPLDVFYKMVSFKVFKAVILVLKEVHRVRNVQNGVETVIGHYSGYNLNDLFFVAVMIGSIRGSAAKFLLRPLDSFVQGNLGADNEFLKPTFTTKHTVLTGILLMLQRMGHIQLDESILITILFIVAGAVQIAILFTALEDPYKMVEKLLSAILFDFPEEVTKKAGKKNKTD